MYNYMHIHFKTLTKSVFLKYYKYNLCTKQIISIFFYDVMPNRCQMTLSSKLKISFLTGESSLKLKYFYNCEFPRFEFLSEEISLINCIKYCNAKITSRFVLYFLCD